VLPKRWIVEQTFGWVNRARRLAKDFETSISSSPGLVSRCRWLYCSSAGSPGTTRRRHDSESGSQSQFQVAFYEAPFGAVHRRAANRDAARDRLVADTDVGGQEAAAVMMTASTGFPQDFRPACRYRVSGGKVVEFEVLDQALWNETGVVYARISPAGDPVQIGSTDGLLCKRMAQHLRLIPDQKNDGYRDWAEGKQIIIKAYKPKPV
jgi:hypothetical protein